MSTETSPTYEIESDLKTFLYAFSIFFIGNGILMIPARLVNLYPISLVIGVLFFFFGRRIVKHHVKIEDGIFIQYSGDRLIKEFDLSSTEEWNLETFVRNDDTDAKLTLKSKNSNKPLELRYGNNPSLFIKVLTVLHKDKRNLARTNPALLESKFPKCETEIRQLLKNW